ncbi:MAG TPA: hypothetical protein VKX28_21750 [Xanthobacteraceae bacterium]|nr:hypothetical protein [Xanthobacteraceae bacterium]
MSALAKLPQPTRIEFLRFYDWKRYADGQGFWEDRPATRPGYCSMVNGADSDEVGRGFRAKPAACTD